MSDETKDKKWENEGDEEAADAGEDVEAHYKGGKLANDEGGGEAQYKGGKLANDEGGDDSDDDVEAHMRSGKLT